MKYISTRNPDVAVSGSTAVLTGLAPDGGLYVPESLPRLSKEDFINLAKEDYPTRAARVLSLLLSDYSFDELLDYTTKAYSRFYGDDPCPLVNIDEGVYVLELWHGPTCAFKDMALTMLPHLLSAARKKVGEKDKTLIMVATSGDTGKAALEGFKDVEGTNIIVFYPSKGVSDMQKLQMKTQTGENVCVCAIEGNFDDTQNAVKNIFADKAINDEIHAEGFKLSSANSINWGRLAPQIAYYVSAYCDLIESGKIEYGDKVNFCVPSGNFGNILAAYYAMQMGVGVNRLICASNVNHVLTDFFRTGTYDINREFHKTISPSMDILISSNLERLIFEVSGRDDKLTAERMNALKKQGKYSVSDKELKALKALFSVGYTDDEETKDTIAFAMDEFGYLMDTHTAVAYGVYCDYADETGDETPTVVVSTANAYKFPADVYEAVSGNRIDDAFEATEKLNEETGEEIPEPLSGLKERPVRFEEVIDRSEIANKVVDYCKQAANK